MRLSGSHRSARPTSRGRLCWLMVVSIKDCEAIYPSIQIRGIRSLICFQNLWLLRVVDGSLGLVFAEEVVDLGEGGDVLEAGHGVFFGEGLGGADEAGPGGAGECGAYGDAA